MRILSMMKRNLYDVLVTAITVLVIILISNKVTVQATRYKRFDLTATDGSFSSPNYPRPYPNNIYYEWILPITSQKLQLEFITFDLYRCYVPRHRQCEAYDFVYIWGNESYCNWNRPPTIILQPWTESAVTFHSSDTTEACRGQGFQAQYKPFLEYETTKKPSTLAVTTKSYALPRVEADSSSSSSLSFLFLLPLLFLSLVLVIVCLYWCCCRRPIATQQERMPTDAGNGHIHGTPIGEEPIGNAMQNSYHNVYLTVNLPQDQQPQQRAESNNAIAQNGPPSTQTVLTHDGRIGCSHESLDMPADEYPPPSYDNVWDENLDLENFDCPPSYEAVMRESRERLDQGAESADLQRNRGTHETPGRLNLEVNLGERGEIVI